MSKTKKANTLPQTHHEFDRDITTIKIIKTEVNINRNPFFCLSDKDIPDTLKIERKDTVEIDGQKVNVLWKVSANPEYGYPGPFAKKVHKAFEVLFSQHGFPLTKVFPFSIYQLLEIMNVSKKGQNYKSVRNAIQQMVSTTIEAKGSFYHKGKQRYIADTYHLFDRVIFKGESEPDGKLSENNYVFISDAYLDSINSFYIKDIDWKYYQQLENVTTARLYEVLDMLFYPVINKKLVNLKISYKKLCEYMPLKQASFIAKAKQQLDRHHNILVKTGFLAGYKYEQKETSKGNDFNILYYPGALAKKDKNRQAELSWDGHEINLADSDEGIIKSAKSIEKRKDGDLRSKYLERIQTFGLGNADEILTVSPHSHETINRLLNDFESKVKSGYQFKSSPQAWLHWALMSEKYVPPTKGSFEVKPTKKPSKLLDAQKDLQEMYTKLRDLLNDQEYDQEWLKKTNPEKISSLMSSFPFEFHLKNKRKPTDSETKSYDKTVKANLDDLTDERRQMVDKRGEEIRKLRASIQSKMETLSGNQ